MKRRKLIYGRITMFLLEIIILSLFGFFVVNYLFKGVVNISSKNDMFIAANCENAVLYNMEYQEVEEIVRGTKVVIFGDEIINNDKKYYKVNYKKNDYYILSDNLV